MSVSKTKIQWCDSTWSPVRGCSIVSPGCQNCYAMRTAYRLGTFENSGYAGLTKMTRKGPRWTGVVRPSPDRTLMQPLRWREPRRIFVNSMSDAFHQTLTTQFRDHLDRMFAVMFLAEQHQFQLLTKRPLGAYQYLNDIETPRRIAQWAALISKPYREVPWPLPNLWVGTSVEDQKRYDERVHWLLRAHAAVRFLSIEPQIDNVRLKAVGDTLGPIDLSLLHWIIVGGESGPGARKFHCEWARDLLVDAGRLGIAVFVKQLGARPYDLGKPMKLRDQKGGNIREWPKELRVRQYPRRLKKRRTLVQSRRSTDATHAA